jgi:hypothetical protein
MKISTEPPVFIKRECTRYTSYCYLVRNSVSNSYHTIRSHNSERSVAVEHVTLLLRSWEVSGSHRRPRLATLTEFSGFSQFIQEIVHQNN